MDNQREPELTARDKAMIKEVAARLEPILKEMDEKLEMLLLRINILLGWPGVAVTDEPIRRDENT